jgi:prenyltransferase beta subunit
LSAGTLPCATRLRQAAVRGARALSEGARGNVADYLESQRAADGGFVGRDGASDLYYTLFGLDALASLEGRDGSRKAARYLEGYGDGDDLNLVDLCCLARCLALTPGGRRRARRLARRLDGFIADSGGYSPLPSTASGSISASFAVQLAHDELGLTLPVRAGVETCLAARRCGDGAWNDVPGLENGTTTVTAAAALMLSARGQDVGGAGRWLAARHVPTGGFLASPRAPAPDLLSTAAALLALQALGSSLGAFVEPAVAFIESLWCNDGGFRGCAADPLSDCEFTYYALVALGTFQEDVE